MSEKLTPEVVAVIAAMIHRQAMSGFQQVMTAKLRSIPIVPVVCSSPQWRSNLLVGKQVDDVIVDEVIVDITWEES